MMNQSKGERKKHIDNIRRRYIEKKARSAVPEERCRKCGTSAWYQDDTEGGWYCFTCGARGYFKEGAFVQY